MKRRYLLLISVFLISACFSVQYLSAQENTTTEKEKEDKLQQAIALQKKAVADQMKAQADLMKAHADQQKELAKIRSDSGRFFYRGNDTMNFYRSGARSSGNSFGGPDMPFRGSPYGSFSGYSGREGDSESTSWDFSKHVKEKTFSKDYSFDVESSVKTVIMNVMGDCKSGQIKVKIVMPGGKVYSDIMIDESGNLNYRKSFSITETENKDKTGEWKFRIEAEKATGFFRISLQTY
jgi:hypothetical protein